MWGGGTGYLWSVYHHPGSFWKSWNITWNSTFRVSCRVHSCFPSLPSSPTTYGGGSAILMSWISFSWALIMHASVGTGGMQWWSGELVCLHLPGIFAGWHIVISAGALHAWGTVPILFMSVWLVDALFFSSPSILIAVHPFCSTTLFCSPLIFLFHCGGM